MFSSQNRKLYYFIGGILVLVCLAVSLLLFNNKKTVPTPPHVIPNPSVGASISPPQIRQTGLRMEGTLLFHDRLGILIETQELSFIPAGSGPTEEDYGKRIDIVWQPIEIAGGYFYNKNGEMIGYKEVAKAYRYNESIKDIPITTGTIIGLPAAYFEVTPEMVPYPSFTPFSLVAIQKGQLVYVFKADTRANLDLLISVTKFNAEVRFSDDSEPRVQPTEEAKVFIPALEPNNIVNSEKTGFIGKIRQGAQQFLPFEFEIKGLSYNREFKRFQLTFKPGEVKNLDILIDNKKVSKIYGFPQYPTIYCDEIIQSTMGGQYDDPLLYSTSRNYNPFTTAEECIEKRKDSLPPLIFVFNPDQPLTEGAHTLSVRTGNGYIYDQKFLVNKSFKPQVPLFPTGMDDPNSTYTFLDAADSCMPGYHYDSTYLPIPLPRLGNNSLVYTLTFPQSESEKKIYAKKREVYMKFDSSIFPLKFPDSSVFYFEGEKVTIDGRDFLAAEKSLYVPRDYLYYSDSTKADVWTQDGYYSNTYLELYPTDQQGFVYEKNVLPWTTTSFSGCDG